MKRWIVSYVAVDGSVPHTDRFVFRRNAIACADRMSSPLYDVTIERSDGTRHEVLHRHMDPKNLDVDEFIRRLRP